MSRVRVMLYIGTLSAVAAGYANDGAGGAFGMLAFCSFLMAPLELIAALVGIRRSEDDDDE